MGRLTTIAVLVAVVAGVITIAAGGVDSKDEDPAPKAQIASADHRDQQLAEAAEVGAVVPMRALEFVRRKVTVKAGETVRFVNRDDVAHDVFATLGGESGVVDFHSPRIAPDSSYLTPVLAQPGTYTYVCTLHPTVMSGVIEVTR